MTIQLRLASWDNELNPDKRIPWPEYDKSALFRDPYNPTSYGAYMGFSYGVHVHEQRIAPAAAAQLLTYLEELEDERIYGPDALEHVEAYLHMWLEEEADHEHPSETLQLGTVLTAMIGHVGPEEGEPEERAFYESLAAMTGQELLSFDMPLEKWLSHWRQRHEGLTGLLREAIRRGEPLECTGVIYHEEG